MVRADVLTVREREFVVAARALGAANRVIIPRHVLPNVLTPIIIVATFSVATNIITEASLSFLGLGVEPTIPTWGSMLADGRAYIGRAWSRTRPSRVWPFSSPCCRSTSSVMPCGITWTRACGRSNLDVRPTSIWWTHCHASPSLASS